MNTDQITKIIIVSCKYLGKALLDIAHDLDKPNSQASIIESLDAEMLEITVGVHVLFALKKGKKGAGIVNKIDGDAIGVANKATGQTWTVQRSDILHVSMGDFYY